MFENELKSHLTEQDQSVLQTSLGTVDNEVRETISLAETARLKTEYQRSFDIQIRGTTTEQLKIDTGELFCDLPPDPAIYRELEKQGKLIVLEDEFSDLEAKESYLETCKENSANYLVVNAAYAVN